MDESEVQKTQIGKVGKFGLIDQITRNSLISNRSTVLGIGDDAAVSDHGELLTLVTTDLLLEGIHFNLVYTPLKHLGYKAVIRAVSDIYAMNGKPSQILIGIGISSRFLVEDVEKIYTGINLACKKYDVDLAGGDVSSSLTGLTISVTATGTVDRKHLVKRDGAQANDLICVTGDLGASYMGLQLLERERIIYEKTKGVQPDLSRYEYLIGRQLKPEFPKEIIIRLKEGEILPNSMIDISDGLSSELLHLCKDSVVGCKIYYEKIPIDQATISLAEEFNIDPSVPALNGGEDYELLFTVPLNLHAKIAEIKNVKVIGHITEKEQGCYLVSDGGTAVPLTAQGWV
jgi:thiamine-monophosphate kinase